jgi:hypothetical protein
MVPLQHTHHPHVCYSLSAMRFFWLARRVGGRSHPPSSVLNRCCFKLFWFVRRPGGRSCGRRTADAGGGGRWVVCFLFYTLCPLPLPTDPPILTHLLYFFLFKKGAEEEGRSGEKASRQAAIGVWPDATPPRTPHAAMGAEENPPLIIISTPTPPDSFKMDAASPAGGNFQYSIKY